jgi:hypothetical protein
MKMSDDLMALVFELQRARRPADKARALARAWRTVRRLSPEERRLLAREVGFNGADDLVDGLAGKSGGAFAPAAVLEALGRMRNNEDLSLRGILSDLRDPERRDDLLSRGADLVVDSVSVADTHGEEPTTWAYGDDEIEVIEPESEPETGEPAGGPTLPEADEVEAEMVTELAPPPPPPPVEPVMELTDEAPIPAEWAEQVEETVDEPRAPEEAEELSEWDEIWTEPAAVAFESAADTRHGPGPGTILPVVSEGRERSLLVRLRELRSEIPDLRPATVGEIRLKLESFPEGWARRRALVALIEGDTPDDAGAVLDLIEELERPMDRRWCLSALARRGDLDGDELERGVELLTSPAARRRVRALAIASG